jgi:death-on-curing protein
MGRTGEPLDQIEFLEFEEVLEINRQMILAYGGLFTEGDNNLANPGSLMYTLEMIQGSFFGHNPCPTVVEKAAFLGWRIITGHIFHDGNKRTGIESCRLMLDLNGYSMKIDREVIDITEQICEDTVSFVEFVQWLEEHIVEKT